MDTETRFDVFASSVLVCLGVLFAPVSSAGAILGPPPAGNLLVSTVVDSTHTYTGAVRPVTAGTSMGGAYQLDGAGPTFTAPPNSATFGDSSRNVSYSLASDAGTLQTATSVAANALSGHSANIGSFSQAYNWFVVDDGGIGAAVTLTANVLIQGMMTADSGNPGGSFFDSLTFIASPDDTVRTRVMVFQGSFSSGCSGTPSQITSTVAEMPCIPQNGTTQTVNYIIRSNPFIVTAGIPFFLALSANATVGLSGNPDATVYPTSVSMDFLDPGLVLPGQFTNLADPLFGESFLVKNASGAFVPLPNEGLSVRGAVPEPGTMLQELAAKVAGVGPGKSLANKVRLAQTYYAVPDVQATCAVLTDFVSEVKAQAGKKKLTATKAATLTSDANAVMAAIGCK